MSGRTGALVLGPTFNRPDWMANASCLDQDPDAFFPVGPSRGQPGPSLARLEAFAKSICCECPVRSQCLDHALANEDYGIWGGTTEDERATLRKRQARVRATATERRRHEKRHSA